MQNKLENLWLNAVGVGYWLRKKFTKLFPYAAVAFAVLDVVGIAKSSDMGTLTAADAPAIFATAAIYTITTLLYFWARQCERYEGRRHRR